MAKKESTSLYARRLNNVVWDITGAYKEEVAWRCLELRGDFEADFLKAVTAGILLRWDDFKGWQERFFETFFISSAVSPLSRVALLALYVRAYVVSGKKQKGLGVFYRRRMEEVQRRFGFSLPRDLFEQLLYAITQQLLHGKIAGSCPALVKEAAHAVIAAAQNEESEEFLKQLQDALQKHFYAPFSEASQSDSQEEKSVVDKQADVWPESSKEDSQEVASSEFSSHRAKIRPSSSFAEKQKEAVRFKSLEIQDEKIASLFGFPSSSPGVAERLAKRLSRGLHSNSRFWLTQGELTQEQADPYRYRQIQEAYRETSSWYALHQVRYRRLRQEIASSLQEATDFSGAPPWMAQSGVLQPQRLWQAGRLSHPKVFAQIPKLPPVMPRVDLLVDISASQSAFFPELPCELLSLWQALTMAGFICRVVGYHNFLRYSILQQIATPFQADADAFFKLLPSGSNRDGLILQAWQSLYHQKEKGDQILILFSDALPNDIKFSQTGVETFAKYEGALAIRDTRRQFFSLREKLAGCVCCYTGDLENKKKTKDLFGSAVLFPFAPNDIASCCAAYLKAWLERL